MLEIKIVENSASITIKQCGFNVTETAAQVAHAYVSALLSVKGANQQNIIFKSMTGFMEGIDRALRDADPGYAAFANQHKEEVSEMVASILGKRGDFRA